MFSDQTIISLKKLLHFIRVLFWISLMAIMEGCGGNDEKDNAPIRPVKTYRVENTPSHGTWTYPGEIKARIETILSFRVSGKMLERPVEIGDPIRKGHVLAKLDSSDYHLSAQAVKSQLIAAKAEMEFSADELTRHRELLRQKVISQPDLDKRETTYVAARERVAALQAQLSQTINQTRYAVLMADRSGVVTAVHAEPGQVVSAGQPVLSLAMEDGKEVHFDIPEDRINQINVGDSLLVSLWNNQDHQIEAHIREIAVSADPANRTYRVKATLSSSRQDLKLGRSVTVRLSSGEQEVLGIPLSAVFAPHDKHDQTKVWVVDENKRSVSAVPVQLGPALPENRIAVKGVEPGQLLVSAGVHRLREGQVIRLPIETTAWPETRSVVVNKSEGQQP